MTRAREILLCGLVVVAFACSGSSAVPPLSSAPAAETRATLVGPLCQLHTCQCREDGADQAQVAPEGKKRFEIRLGPVENSLWLSVGDMVLYKSTESALQCFYIDLPPGRHPLSLRASEASGFAARLEVRELAPESAGWYRTFDFVCGAPGTCDRGALHSFGTRIAGYERNVHDPCGSTKIRGVTWQTGRLPDSVPPGDLQLDFVLDVYEHSPTFGPKSPECADKREAAGTRG